MAGPMKMRATLAGGNTDVRVLMTHPMTTAQQSKNQPHFIQNVTVRVNGKPVIEAEISQAISRNPVFAFKVKGAKAGDEIAITWKDNKGETRTDKTTVRGGS